MSLVVYSDSEDENVNTDATIPRQKRIRDDGNDDLTPPQKAPKRAPALPQSIHSLYASNVRSSTSDDPALHGGRQRQVPHTIGTWPSFVYLEWLPSAAELIVLENLLANTQSLSLDDPPWLQSLLRSDLGVRLPLHVSLSAPLQLSTNNKDEFESSLRRAVHATDVSSFTVVPSKLRWVHNFENTRYFLILTLTRPKDDELQRLLAISNAAARSFSLPELYARDQTAAVGGSAERQKEISVPTKAHVQDDDKFHVSIAWTLQQSNIDHQSVSTLPAEISEMSISFDKVNVKIGNQVSTIPLLAPTKR